GTTSQSIDFIIDLQTNFYRIHRLDTAMRRPRDNYVSRGDRVISPCADDRPDIVRRPRARRIAGPTTDCGSRSRNDDFDIIDCPDDSRLTHSLTSVLTTRELSSTDYRRLISLVRLRL